MYRKEKTDKDFNKILSNLNEMILYLYELN